MEISNTIKRTLSIILLLLVVLLSIFVFDDLVFSLLIMFFISLGLNEFFNLIRSKGIDVYKKLGILIGLIIPLSIFLRFKPTEEWTLLFILVAFITFFVLQFAKKDHTDAILGISTTVFGVIYISWLGSYFIKIKLLPNGGLFIIFILLTTKMADVGAYLIGKKFGRHKLLVRISPKKSIEGAIGGFLTSIIFSLLSKFYLSDISLYHLFILGILVGISSQLGDLSESLIKRSCNVKDSGRFIPAQGGVLDLIDSLLFSAPVAYLYIMAYKLYMVP